MVTRCFKIFVLALAIGVCAFLTRTAQAAEKLVSPGVYQRFQALGADLSRDTQGLDALLSRAKHKKGAASLSRAELAEFRALRTSITGRQREVLGRLHDMEQSFIANGADPLFLERHRKMTEDIKDRFADLSDRLNREDLDALAENGIRSIMKGQREPGSKKDIPPNKLRVQKSDIQTLPNRPPARKQNIDEIWGPRKEEIKDGPPKMFPRTDGKLGLFKKDGAFQLVKFEPAESTERAYGNTPLQQTQQCALQGHGMPCPYAFSNTEFLNSSIPEFLNFQSKIQTPQSKFVSDSNLAIHNPEPRPLNSELAISPVSAWDLDLPQSVRPVMVAGLGDVAGLLSQATMQAITPPSDNTTLIEDGIDIAFSGEIKALADSLGKDPIKMYDYVKNNIAYQPYWGSLKGARQTLLEKRGNDCDQASLLIALLRYSGYPARYGEAVVTVDIARAKSWLGVQQDDHVGYLLASAHVPDVKDLYSGSSIVQVQFKHIYAEVYLAYENYRGQIRPNGGQKLWVPLSPAFKKEIRTPGVSVPFDTEGFLQGLQDHATYNADGGLTSIDKNYIREQTDIYAAAIQAFIDSQNPAMTMNQFYGYSTIAAENYPILPITLPFPFDPGSVSQYSALDELQRHRIVVELSYWGVDLDEELDTLEINYTAPTAAVAGKRFTLSYRPATAQDKNLLSQYDGNLFGAPLCLIHMYPQLKLGGVVVDENVGRDAEISMGLEETLRVKMLQPGELNFGYSSRQNDYKITVGDHVAIVPGLGGMPREQLQESLQRLARAVTDGAPDIDLLLGEQLHLTGSSYFYQLDTWYGLIAKQAGVRWFRNPSDIIVSRHLTVDWFLNYVPVSVKESTIIIDAPGNRFQAVPEQGDWKNRVAFLKTAGLYGSIMEHTVLQELFQQNAVSGVKLLNAVVDNGTAIHEINPQMTLEQQNAVLAKLNLSAETMKIIDQELNLGQTVLAPANDISVGTYRGAAIISSTPPNDPMGAFREGYLIARAADGGQITDIIRNLLNGFVNPSQADWLQFQKTAEGAVSSIITNSDDIRDGHLQVRELLNGVTGMAMSWYMCMAQSSASALHSLQTIGAFNAGMSGMDDFLGDMWVAYIDFEGNRFYNFEENDGVRTAKYVVLDILGQGKAGKTAAFSMSFRGETFAPDNVTSTNGNGVGAFTFKPPSVDPLPEAGEQIIANLSLTAPDGKPVTTRGTFLVAGCAIKGLFPTDDTDLPVKPGKAAEIQADLLWDSQEIAWSYELVHERKGEVRVNVEFNGRSCYITAAEDTGIGKVLLMAKDPQNPDCYKKIVVPIGCDSCATCRQPGNCDPAVACIDARFSLGKASSGKPAGDIFLLSDSLTAELATPKGLIASALSPDVEVIYRNGAPRQVSAPEIFVDIKTLSDYAYELRFYAPADKGGKVNGLSEISLTASPLNVWRVENPDASPTVFNRLNLTENLEGAVHIFEYAFDAASSTWSLVKGGGLQKISRQESWDSATKNLTVIETVQAVGSPAASRSKTVTHSFAWGNELIERVEGSDAAALTTAMTYYETIADTGNYSHLKFRLNSDGSQVSYEYDTLGRKKKETRGYLDGAASRVTEYAYGPVDSGDTNALRDKYSPRCVIEKIGGSISAKSYYAYKTNGSGERVEITERCSTAAAAFGNAGNERTERTYFKSGTGLAGAGKIKSAQNPDGRLDTYSYEQTGGQLRSTVVHGTVTSPDGIPGKSTKDISIADTFGNELRRETHANVGGSWQVVQWTATAYDAKGRPLLTESSDGTITESQWNCCGKTSDTDARGITTTYTYDDLKRVTSQTTPGPLGDIVTTYTYDAAGRRLAQTVTAGGITQSSTSIYDLAGRLLSSTDAQNLTTSYSYVSNGLVTTVTRPGGATEITQRYPDGRVKSVTGTGVIARYYEYGVNADGSQWTKVSTGSENSPVWEKSTNDILGRTISTEKPGFSDAEVATNFYDTKGRLVKSSTPGMAGTLYEYDELGNQIKSGLDVNGNGALDPASTDRINSSDTSYLSNAGGLWQQTVQGVYVDNAFAPVSTQLSRLTGLGAGRLAAETIAIDINGNRTISRVTIDRSTKTEQRSTMYPDSIIEEQQISVAGVVTSAKSKTGVETTFTYDAFGRRTGSTDPRTGSATTQYDAKGRVASVIDAAHNATTYQYDETTGRKKAEVNADGKYTRYAYNMLGQITATWGDAAYPVGYEYDAYGRLSKMYTYRTGDSWNGDTFTGDAAGDATTWQYHEATGLLTAKVDAAGKAVSYTYGTGGRLATRTWARTDSGSPVATTYAYSAATGELTGIDYSDTTPDVSITYDRIGRQKTVTDAAGSRSFTYGANLQLTAETITGMDNATITRSYDALGRAGGFSLGPDYSPTYGYDTTGRFNNVGWSAAGKTGAASYSYLANSDLLSQLSTDSGQSTSYSYDSKRNLRNQIKNEFGGSVISQYDYNYDKLGRRTGVVNSGTAFIDAAFNRFGYNDRSELTVSNRYLGADTGSTSNPVTAEARAYAYDPIGNRTQATEAAKQLTYTANQLNQYQLISDYVGWATPTVFDADGNLTAFTFGTSTTKYTYDAENRLVFVAPETPAEGAMKIYYAYDYMSRRIKKNVSTYSSGFWSLTTSSTFIYDGWNLVKEIKYPEPRTLTPEPSYYVWGLDLSGTLQGAGGIGGLLARIKEGSVQQYTYDGNGNVGQLVNSDGSVAAHYEYDPYGNAIVATGSDNPFRFSTKYFDSETGLGYWGLRYYSSVLGRWINRDPSDEKGGNNLYGFVKNSPITLYDIYGLIPSCDSGKCLIDATIQNSMPKCKGRICKGASGYNHRTNRENGRSPTYNGCGAADALIKPPQSFGYIVQFKTPCNNHDKCYSTCNKRKTNCDFNLNKELMGSCNQIPLILLPLRAVCYAQANLYYIVVTAGGWGPYEVAQDEVCLFEFCCFQDDKFYHDSMNDN